MPEPRFASGPPEPASGRSSASAKAKGRVSPPDEEVVASTEPDDSLDDYIVPPDPEPAPADRPVADRPVADIPDLVKPAEPSAPAASPSSPSAGPTTADTELVLKLEAELASARARLSGKVADPAGWQVPPPPPEPKKGDVVLIHIRKDGFTANGRVWYQGQELEFTVGEPNWLATVDREGKSWLLLNEADQIRRYGDVMFGHGPWPGAEYDNDKAAAAERARGREAPSIVHISSRTDPAALRT